MLVIAAVLGLAALDAPETRLRLDIPAIELPAPKRRGQTLEHVVLALTVADLAATAGVFALDPRAREGAPLLSVCGRSMPCIAAANVAATAGVALLAREADRRGRHGAARFLRVALVVNKALAVSSNGAQIAYRVEF